MAIDIRLPDISATDPEQAIRQMQSYLYQLAQQLSWAFSTLDNTNIQPEEGEDSQSVELSLRAMLRKNMKELGQEVQGLGNRINKNMDLRTDGKGVTIGGEADMEGFRCKIPADFSGGMTIGGVPLDEYIKNVKNGG